MFLRYFSGIALCVCLAYGQTPEALLQRGMQQGEQRDFNGAVQSFSAAIARNPKYERAYYFRAQAYKYLRQYQAAIADLDRALQLHPYYNAYIAEKVEIYREQGDLNSALKQADDLVIIMPKFEQINPLAFPLRGSVFQAMGLEREAAQEFEYGKYEANLHRHGLNNAIEITNQHIAKYRAVPRSSNWRPPAGAGHAAGMRSLQAGQHRTAIAHFDAEIRTAPDRVDSFFFRGVSYYRLRQYARAADDMQTVLRLNPQHAGAANYLGMATWSFGDREGAIRHYTTAVRLQPKWGTPYYNRALAWVAAKNLGAAMSDLNMTLQLEPKSGAALADRAMVHYRQGNPAGAIADLKSAIALNPKAARLYCNMGVIVADQNRAQAQQWYDRCYAMDPLERAWYEGQERWADAYMAHQRRMADIMAAIAANPSSSSSSSDSGCSSPGACSAHMAGDTEARQRFENNHPSSGDRSRYGPY